jgi:hypothetical protein
MPVDPGKVVELVGELDTVVDPDTVVEEADVVIITEPLPLYRSNRLEPPQYSF